MEITMTASPAKDTKRPVFRVRFECPQTANARLIADTRVPGQGRTVSTFGFAPSVTTMDVAYFRSGRPPV